MGARPGIGPSPAREPRRRGERPLQRIFTITLDRMYIDDIADQEIHLYRLIMCRQISMFEIAAADLLEL